MRKPLARRAPAALAALIGLWTTQAMAEEVIAVTSDNRLITFDTATPHILDSDRAITGITGNVLAIDVRPADGVIYAITDFGTLYRLDPATGIATAVGSDALALTGLALAIDFNPSTDRIRVLTDQGRNFRVRPMDGLMEDGDPSEPGVQPDRQLFYVAGDVNVGFNPSAVAAAHTTDVPGGGVTSLFVVDAGRDVLARLGDVEGSDASRNSGELHTIGILGIDVTAFAGFDVSRTTGTAWAVLTRAGEPSSRLYTISLPTGAATFRGFVGDRMPVRAMTLGPATLSPPLPAVELIGLTLGGELVAFRSDDPTRITTRVAVTGLVAGDELVAIDTRASNGRLYGLGRAGRIYVINSVTGVATPIRELPFEVPLTGDTFSLSFNPGGTRARILSDQGLNLRINPDTGAVFDADPTLPGIQGDTTLRFATGDPGAAHPPSVVAASFQGTIDRRTSLFGIDTNLDTLVRVGSTGGFPISMNTGLLSTIGGLGIDVTPTSALEVADGAAFASIAAPGGTSRLFTIDLATAQTSLIGNVGLNEMLRSITVAPTVNRPGPAEGLVVRHMLIKLDFSRESRDTVRLTGSLPFPGGPLAGRTVAVDVGGFSQQFTLGPGGLGRDRDGTRRARDDEMFDFLAGPANGRVPFSVVLRREDLASAFADEGLTDVTVQNAPRTVRVTVTIDGVPLAADVDVRYTARAGSHGIAQTR